MSQLSYTLLLLIYSCRKLSAQKLFNRIVFCWNRFNLGPETISGLIFFWTAHARLRVAKMLISLQFLTITWKTSSVKLFERLFFKFLTLKFLNWKKLPQFNAVSKVVQQEWLIWELQKKFLHSYLWFPRMGNIFLSIEFPTLQLPKSNSFCVFQKIQTNFALTKWLYASQFHKNAVGACVS